MTDAGQMSTRRPWRRELRIELASRCYSALNRTFSLSYRFRRLQPTYGARRRAGESVRCIYALWHESLWHMTHALERQGVCVMVSAHDDGEMIVRVGLRRGFAFVRGSSTRGGARAMLEMVRAARAGGNDLAVVMDGPRGPPQEIKEGVLFAASRTGLPLVPVGLHVDRAWRAKSWDRHVVGKPFARVVLALGEELRVPADAGREELMGPWRERLAQAMRDAHAQAERACSRRPSPSPR